MMSLLLSDRQQAGVGQERCRHSEQLVTTKQQYLVLKLLESVNGENSSIRALSNEKRVAHLGVQSCRDDVDLSTC